jgi:hypothetical protein
MTMDLTNGQLVLKQAITKERQAIPLGYAMGGRDPCRSTKAGGTTARG